MAGEMPPGQQVRDAHLADVCAGAPIEYWHPTRCHTACRGFDCGVAPRYNAAGRTARDRTDAVRCDEKGKRSMIHRSRLGLLVGAAVFASTLFSGCGASTSTLGAPTVASPTSIPTETPPPTPTPEPTATPGTVTGTFHLGGQSAVVVQVALCQVTQGTGAKTSDIDLMSLTSSGDASSYSLSGTLSASGFSCDVLAGSQQTIQNPSADDPFSINEPAGDYAIVVSIVLSFSPKTSLATLDSASGSLVIVKVTAGGSTDVGTF
jgi:hypothetical protein